MLNCFLGGEILIPPTAPEELFLAAMDQMRADADEMQRAITAKEYPELAEAIRRSIDWLDAFPTVIGDYPSLLDRGLSGIIRATAALSKDVAGSDLAREFRALHDRATELKRKHGGAIH